MFLKILAKHNNREWMQANRQAYEAARADFLQFTQQILTGFAKYEADLLPLQPKDCVFRQNRDVRFSADKSPYKINMGAAFSKGGKKSVLAGYYFHLEPGKSFVGGGLWMPDKVLVQKVRQEIDYCWDEWQLMLKHKSFQKYYDDFSREPEMVLQREPKGYDKNNPAIAYLKMKSWVAAQPLSDASLTEPNLVKNVIDAFKALQPFVHFMNRAIEG
ncbi:DUF2461 domain-containing protein [Hydrotalea sp.]|uniref:DUF2461 domain-containing protein n=1 Tax=Hydrotalea sp. TaxID=2881279 RepID=UPI003D12D245